MRAGRLATAVAVCILGAAPAGAGEVGYDSGTLGMVYTVEGSAWDRFFAVGFYNDTETPLAVKTVKIAGGDASLGGALDVCVWYQDWDGLPEYDPCVYLPDRVLDPQLAWNCYSVWDEAQQAVALPRESIFAGFGLIEPGPCGVPYDDQTAAGSRSVWYDPDWWQWERGAPAGVGGRNLMVRIEVVPRNVWKGLAGDWLDPAKWWYGVPQADQQLTIESGACAVTTGQAAAAEVYLIGQIDQSGGTLTVAQSLHVGYWYHEGTYTLSGGALEVANLLLGPQGNGTLAIADPAAEIRVTATLHLGLGARITAGAGTIHMAGADLTNESSTPADLADLANLRLIFAGGEGAVSSFEVAGADRGPIAAGWTDNFAVGTLQLGDDQPGRITLADDYDNQRDGHAETLYVHELILNAGAVVGLNGLRLYYLNGGDPKQLFLGDVNLNGAVDIADLGQVATYYGQCGVAWQHGDFNGDGKVDIADLGALASNYGAVTGGTPVPEPGTLALLLAGAAALLRRRSST